MNIPSPYFRGVPGIGDLEMDQVIVDYEYPLLSVLKSESDRYFLCMCYDVSDAQRWIIVPISPLNLQALLRNEITLDAPFQRPDAKKVLAEWSFSEKSDSYVSLDAGEEVPERCLPAAGDYLDAEPGEWDAYIKKLNQRQVERVRKNFPAVPPQPVSAVISTYGVYSQGVFKRKAAVSAIWSKRNGLEVTHEGKSVFGDKRYISVSLQRRSASRRGSYFSVSL